MSGRFTAAEKAACAERELKMRERVYPRWVQAGKITPALAARETELMRAIAADYRALAEKERLL